MDLKLFVESISKAHEKIIKKYVQTQLVYMDSKEKNAMQIDLL